jgi:transcriptional regulator with XRE-family HTH domain
MKLTAFSQLLRETRKAQRLSQLDLQDLSGVSASVIYKLEKGRIDVAMGNLLAVAQALGMHLVARSPLGREVNLNG